MSAGVRGFRIGTGPRGNYVHMGTGGLYYRRTLPSWGNSPAAAPHRQPAPASPYRQPSAPAGTLGHVRAIDSADAATMVDTNSAALLAEINQKQRKWPIFPLVLALGVLCTVLVALG